MGIFVRDFLGFLLRGNFWGFLGFLAVRDFWGFCRLGIFGVFGGLGHLRVESMLSHRCWAIDVGTLTFEAVLVVWVWALGLGIGFGLGYLIIT